MTDTHRHVKYIVIRKQCVKYFFINEVQNDKAECGVAHDEKDVVGIYVSKRGKYT